MHAPGNYVTYHGERSFPEVFYICLDSTAEQTHHCRSTRKPCHCPTSTCLSESRRNWVVRKCVHVN